MVVCVLLDSDALLATDEFSQLKSDMLVSFFSYACLGHEILLPHTLLLTKDGLLCMHTKYFQVCQDKTEQQKVHCTKNGSRFKTVVKQSTQTLDTQI